MATPAKSWREAREEGVELTLLYSGNVASIRPVEMDFFVRVGRVPDFLIPTVIKYMAGETLPELPINEEIEKSKEFVEFLNELVKFAFVSPVVRDTPTKDEPPLGESEISVDDISYADKLWLYRYVFARPAHVLRRFRDAINAVASMVPESDDERATVQDAEGEQVGLSDNGNARHVDRLTA